MSSVNNLGLSLLNKYLQDMGVKNPQQATQADLNAIFTLAGSDSYDVNGDGKVQNDEFRATAEKYYAERYSSQDIQQLNDEYLDAWNQLAGLDGDAETLSDADLKKSEEIAAGGGTDAAEAADEAGDSGKTDANKGGDDGGDNPGSQGPATGDPTANSITDVPAAVTEGKTSDQLKSDKTSSLSSIQSLADQKATQEQEIADSIANAEANYGEAEGVVSDTLAELADCEKGLDAEKQIFTNLQSDRNDAQSAVSTAEGNVQIATSLVSDAEGQLADANAMPDKIPSETETDSEGNPVMVDNPDKPPAVQAAQTALADAQAELAAAQQELQTADQQLQEVDRQVQEQVDAVANAEGIVDDTYAQADIDKEAFDAARTSLSVARQDRIETLSEINDINTAIQKHNDNVSVYDDAIKEREIEEQREKEDEAVFKDSKKLEKDENGNYTYNATKNQEVGKIVDEIYDIASIQEIAEEQGITINDARQQLIDAFVAANNKSDLTEITGKNGTTYKVNQAKQLNVPDPYEVLQGTVTNHHGTESPATLTRESDRMAAEKEAADAEKANESKETLETEEIDEIVDDLLRAVEDGVFEEVWSDTDFSKYDNETQAAIVAAYNEKGGDFFADYKAQDSAKYEEQCESIVNALMSQADEMHDILAGGFDSAIKNGDNTFLEAMLSSAETYAYEFKGFMEQYDAMNPNHSFESKINEAKHKSDEWTAAIKQAQEALEPTNNAETDELTQKFVDRLLAGENNESSIQLLANMSAEQFARVADAYKQQTGNDISELIGDVNEALGNSKDSVTSDLSSIKMPEETEGEDTEETDETENSGLQGHDQAVYEDRVNARIEEKEKAGVKVTDEMKAQIAEDVLAEMQAEREGKKDVDGTLPVLGREISDVVDELNSQDWAPDALQSLSNDDLAAIRDYLGEETFNSKVNDGYKVVQNKIEDNYEAAQSEAESPDATKPNDTQGYNAEIEELIDSINNYKDDPIFEEQVEADRQQVADQVNDALKNPNLSVEERLDILENVAENCPEALAGMFDSGSFSSTSEIVTSLLKGCDSPQDACAVLDTLNEIGGADFDYNTYFESESEPFGIFSTNNKETSSEYIDAIIGLYEGATPEEVTLLNEKFNTAGMIQELFSGDVETEKLNALFKNISPESAPSVNGFDANDYSKYADNYIGDKPKATALKDIISAVNSGNLTNDKAQWLLYTLYDGDTTQMVADLRGQSSRNEVANLPVLLGLYGLDN